MKKITFSIALSVISLASVAQKTILVNGGRFGNQAENVSVTVYDTQTNNSTTIDSIGSQSVQDILIDGNIAFVAAQDSIIRYNLTNNTRTAAVKFRGPSTKTMVFSSNNELVVANWYNPFGGPAMTHHLYIYDQTTLALKDSIGVQGGGIKSMIGSIGGVLITQNSSSSSFSDTLGYALMVDVASRTVIDTLRAANYTGEMGELIAKPNVTNGFYAINSGSNTITNFSNPSIIPPFFTVTNVATAQNLKVEGKSHYEVNGDTLFLRMNQGIGSINLTNLAVIDSNLIDTVVTAFAYDTANFKFYVTATDFVSYTSGKIYNRVGNYSGSFATASSPEVIAMSYNQTTGLLSFSNKENSRFSIYPNPATNRFSINGDLTKDAWVQILNYNGQLVKKIDQLNVSSQINISNLTSGIYFVNILMNNTISTQKLIIQ